MDIIKLLFESSSTGGGLDEFATRTKESVANVSKLSMGVNRLASSLGAAGQAAGAVVTNILRGGIWGAAAEGVRLVISAYTKWRDAAKMAAEAQESAMKEAAERGRAAAEAMRESFAKSAAAISEHAKRQKEDIELTKQQTKAALELAAAKAKASGNEKRAAELSRQASAAERSASEESASVSVEAATKALASARKAAGGLAYVDKDGNFDAKGWDKERRARNQRIVKLRREIERAEQEQQLVVSESVMLGAAGAGGGNRKVVDIATMKKELEAEIAAKKNLVESAPKMRQAAENIAEARRQLDRANKAAETAARRSEAAEIIDRKAAADESRAEAEKSLREKIAALEAQKAAMLGGAGGSTYKSQFERAFELWRDPEAAKAAQDEEKRREEDMKRYRKDVNRYGGKWRIDEYAELMRNGDTEGMQSKLAEWRKSSRFTPQVEQMVKAAAAEQNENAAERALQNIERNTADLAAKIDQLLSVK